MDYLLGFLNVVIVILTLFLIVLILIQRGKGGGLAGASAAWAARAPSARGLATSSPRSPWAWPSPGSCSRCSWSFSPIASRQSDWDDRNAVDRDTARTRDSKSKSRDSGGTGSPSTSRSDMPESAKSALPDDLKVLAELPDPLDTIAAPPRITVIAYSCRHAIESRLAARASPTCDGRPAARTASCASVRSRSATPNRVRLPCF